MLYVLPILWLFTVVWALHSGSSKKLYSAGEKVELLFNKIESDHTQLPYRYHDLSFVCYDRSKKSKPLSLGEILSGDRFWESNYNLEFGVDKPCDYLCDMLATPNGIARADYLVRNGYVVHWSLDGLPGATTFQSTTSKSKYYAAAFPLGFVKNDVSYYYNHVMLVVRYRREKNNKFSIVGFEVYPKSVSDQTCPGSSKNYKNFPLTNKDANGNVLQQIRIPYTYAVYWREDNSIKYENRWDLYYQNDNSESSKNIHFISLVNLLVLVCLVSLGAAIVLIRFLKVDLKPSAVIPLDTKHEPDNSGLWKNLSNTVVQKPKAVLLLTTVVACGIQCLVAGIGVVVLLLVNSKLSLSPGNPVDSIFGSHRGTSVTLSLLILLQSGFVSAYSGIVLHKLLNNDHPNTRYTPMKVYIYGTLFSLALPLTLLFAILFLNLFVWAKESSDALPFFAIVKLVCLFIVIELPLGMLGGYYGNRFSFANKSAVVKSYVPNSEGAKRHNARKFQIFGPFVTVACFGLIPFFIIYVDLLFIFNSVWLEKTTFYYMYGFLLLTTLLLLIVISESAIVATYLSLAVFNNPNWQWLCFQAGSSIGWYVYGYTIYYFIRYLHMSDIVSVLIYFAYMALASFALGIGGGAVGVITATIFVRTIYGAVKVD